MKNAEDKKDADVVLTVSAVKNTTVKVDNNSKKELFGLFEYFTSVAGRIKDNMYKLDSDESTSDIYKDYVQQAQRGRGATTTLFTKLDAEKVYTGKVSFPGKWRDSGIFPMYKKEDGKFDLTTNGYHYSANAEIHAQLDSHNECNNLCVAEYEKLLKEVKEYREKLNKEFKNKNLESFYEFIEKLTLMGWRFDHLFCSFFKIRMHPKLQEGETTYRATFKLESGKTKRYSFFREEVADEIAKNKQFWPMLESEDAVKWITSNNLLFRKKQRANYSSTTLIKSQIRLFLGNNGVPFALREQDGRMYFSFRMPSVGNEKGKLLDVPCSYKKVYNGKVRKSCYFGGLTIEKTDSGNYILKYSVNHKRPQVAELKECFLRLVVRNHSYFEKMVSGNLTEKDGELKSSYFDFYIDLPMNVKEDPIHDLSSSDVFGKDGLRAYYSSAYPEIKNFGGQIDPGKKTECPVTKLHNIMGIDLGQRNPFAYCIKDNTGNIVAQGHFDGSPNDVYKKYINFGKQATSVSHLIRETRSYLFGDNEAISNELYDEVKTFCNITHTYDQYLKYLDTKKFLVNKEDPSKNQTYLLRQKEHGWVMRECLWYLNKQYKKLNADRIHEADWRQTLYWIDSLYRLIDAMKSFHNFGSYYDKNLKKKINGTGRGFCRTIQEQINNNNDDMLKKVTNELIPIVRKYKVSVVVVEKLESMLGDKSRHTFENRNYNLWPVGQLKKFLENKLAPFNVALVEVDERNTSQVYQENWSYRDADDLYSIVDGKIHKVHADENAARNIVDRCILRHTNMYSLYMVNPKDNYYVPKCLWDSKEKGGKLIRGFLTKMYKNSDVVFVKEDNVLVKSKLSVKKLKKIVGKAEKKLKGHYWYRVNGNSWIDEGTRDNIIAGVASSVRESRGGKATSDGRSQNVTLPVLEISETIRNDKVVV